MKEITVFKEKADTLPEEFIKDNSINNPSVERWLKNRDYWMPHSTVYVQLRDFIVDRETQKLYVKKTASVATKSWVGGSITLRRIHTGYLRAEFDDSYRFNVGDATKHHQIIHILYKLTKVDDTVPLAWWNEV